MNFVFDWKIITFHIAAATHKRFLMQSNVIYWVKDSNEGREKLKR